MGILKYWLAFSGISAYKHGTEESYGSKKKSREKYNAVE